MKALVGRTVEVLVKGAVALWRCKQWRAELGMVVGAESCGKAKGGV